MTWAIHVGDCRDVLASMNEASVDTVICDPPYGLSFMGKGWDHAVPGADYWRAVLRVAKPGAMLLAFGGTRTFHRLAAAIEDAGWEVRDCLSWLYGSGFPKSLDIAKALDRRKDWASLEKLQGKIKDARTALGITQSEAARRCGLIGPDERLAGGGFMWFETGMRVPTREQWPALKRALSLDDECDAAFEHAEREVLGERTMADFTKIRPVSVDAQSDDSNPVRRVEITAPATDAAKRWHGWGTALKPAWEPIILAMKPLDGTFAENAQRHGVAGLAIDAGRIDGAKRHPGNYHDDGKVGGGRTTGDHAGSDRSAFDASAGRFPANVLLDEVAAAALDEQAGERSSGARAAGEHQPLGFYANGIGDRPDGMQRAMPALFGDSGGASRFFYVAKAARAERGVGNDHPTVKPVDLMRYLARLTRTPSGGVVLGPFCGSGSTGVGAMLEGRDFIGIELDPHNASIARHRVAEADPIGRQEGLFT